MATAIIMPRQGQSVESCIIGQWHKNVGDSVSSGDLLFTYETDKATFDETAKEDGTILAILYEQGDDVPCLSRVCVIGNPGEDIAEFLTEEIDTGETDSEKTLPGNPEKSVVPPLPEHISGSNIPDDLLPSAATEGIILSPRAKNLAERSHVDLRFARGSGPHDRILEKDIQTLILGGKIATPAAGEYIPGIEGTGLGGRVSVSDAINSGKTSAAAGFALKNEVTTEKHTQIRKVTARAMHASLSEMAQLTLQTSFDATDILDLRKKLKQAAAAGLSPESGFALAENIPTINDIIVYATIRVLLRYKECNAHYDDEKMTYFSHVHMGIATDTKRGLMVPTVFYADTLSLPELSKQIKAVAGACREGSVSPDLLKGGTFTVTNLGTMGIEYFTPVINPPQTCILGVGAITTRVLEKEGEIKPYSAMGLSLTFDHRALDGSPAARFLKELVSVLEHFSLLLMK